MPNKTTESDRIMRKRFGAWLKATREEIGLTQLDVAALLNYGYSAMVSQLERGVTAPPASDLRLLAEILRMEPEAFGKKYCYFLEPDLYHCLYGRNPYDLEKLPRSDKTIKPAARKPLRPV